MYLTSIDVISQSSLENLLECNVPDGAAFHSDKVIFLINPAPFNNPVKFGFENVVKPNTNAAAISNCLESRDKIKTDFLLLILKK